MAIDKNFINRSEYIFAPIFGKTWDKLPLIFKKHYANRGFSSDVYLASGTMSINIAPFLQPFSWILAFTKTLAPIHADNVKTEVHFISEPNSNAFWFDRDFYPEGKKPLKFKSRLVPIGENSVIEYTQSGLGWKAQYEYTNGRVRLIHKGYILRLWNRDFHLPLDWLLGQSSAYETAINDYSFAMYMEIRHWLFGKLYSYEGVFEMKGFD